MKTIFTTDIMNSENREDLILEELKKYDQNSNVIKCMDTFVERNDYIFIFEYCEVSETNFGCILSWKKL